MFHGFMNQGHHNVFLDWLIPLILLALIVLSIYSIIKNNQATRNEKEPSINNALEILDERYARGEIDEIEYEKIKKNLRKD